MEVVILAKALENLIKDLVSSPEKEITDDARDRLIEMLRVIRGVSPSPEAQIVLSAKEAMLLNPASSVFHVPGQQAS